MKRISLLLCSFLMLAYVHAQTSYYVDGVNGHDTSSGLALTHAWKTIQKACNAAVPNSTVLIKGGTYFENPVVNVSGTSGNPITFRNYQNDSVYIDGTGTVGTTMLQMTDKNYLNFEGLVIQNLTVNNAQGILVQTSQSGTSTALSFRKMIIRRIAWTASAATIPTSTDNAQAFIVYGLAQGLTNLTIDSCRVYANILGFSEAVSLDGNISGFSVTHCLVHDNTNIGILAAGNYGTSTNPSTDHARNGTISDNTCYRDVSSYATSGGIYVDGGKSVIIERNKSYENGYGIELGCEQNGTTDSITVRDNLFFNNQEAGLAIGGYTTSTTGQVLNSLVRNNTFFQNNSLNDGTGEIDMTKASSCVLENNLFYTNAQNILLNIESIAPQTNNTLDYNCWYTPGADSTNITVNWGANTYTTFSSYRTGASQELHSFYANPQATNAVLPTPDLHLALGSPCQNKGNPSTVTGSGETDYEGKPRVTGGIIDIGAYESTLALGISTLLTDELPMMVYPVPASEFISIRSDKTIERIEILSSEGKSIRNMVTHNESICVSDLYPGLYFVRMIGLDGSVETRRFIVK